MVLLTPNICQPERLKMGKGRNGMKKFDMFSLGKEFNGHARDYVLTKVLAKQINLEYDKKVAETEASIEALNNLKGSAHEDRIPELRAIYEKALADYETQRNNELDRQAKFEWTEVDKDLRAKINNLTKDGKVANKDDVEKLVINYFNALNVNVEDTDLLKEIMDKVGNKFDFKTLVASDGATADNLDKSKVLTMIMTTVFNKSVEVEAIKAVDLPEIIRNAYASKKKGGKKNK